MSKKISNPPPPPLSCKPPPPPSPPLAFIPDWGQAERIERVLEFTEALAKDPRGAAFIGQQVAEILASDKNVYVKVVLPNAFSYCEHGMSERCSECPPNGSGQEERLPTLPNT